MRNQDDLLLRAANEFCETRRRLLSGTGIRPSVCSAKRCLEMLRMGNNDIAKRYLAMAEARDPGEWDKFGALVREVLAAFKSPDPSAPT